MNVSPILSGRLQSSGIATEFGVADDSWLLKEAIPCIYLYE